MSSAESAGASESVALFRSSSPIDGSASTVRAPLVAAACACEFVTNSVDTSKSPHTSSNMIGMQARNSMIVLPDSSQIRSSILLT